MNWLDTETKSILQKEREPKLAPPKAAEFGLVLLRKGTGHDQMIRAVRRINECTEPEAAELIRPAAPVVINPGLTEGEALLGQFELICCDAISAFVRSEVLLKQPQRDYLQELFQKVLESPEFQAIEVRILELPATEAGQKFLDQFVRGPTLNTEKSNFQISIFVPFKKARIMKHWADRVGARVEYDTVGDAQDEDVF